MANISGVGVNRGGACAAGAAVTVGLACATGACCPIARHTAEETTSAATNAANLRYESERNTTIVSLFSVRLLDERQKRPKNIDSVRLAQVEQSASIPATCFPA